MKVKRISNFEEKINYTFIRKCYSLGIGTKGVKKETNKKIYWSIYCRKCSLEVKTTKYFKICYEESGC